MRAAGSQMPRKQTGRPVSGAVPHSAMRLFTLMANGDAGECRPLSIQEAANHMGIEVNVARACFTHPYAWQTVLHLVDERGDRIHSGPSRRLHMEQA
jgi:hypothetical protein